MPQGHDDRIDALGPHDEIANERRRPRAVVAKIAEIQPSHAHESALEAVDLIARDVEADDGVLGLGHET